MRIRFPRTIAIALLCFSSAWAAEGEDVLTTVKELIHRSFHTSIRAGVVPGSTEILRIENASDLGTIFNGEQFVAHKYLMSHWRMVSKTRLLDALQNTGNREEFLALLNSLLKVNTALEQEEISQVWKRGQEFGFSHDRDVKKGISDVVGQLGDVADLIKLKIWREMHERGRFLAGPDGISVPPLHYSIRWGRDRWIALPQAGHYIWKGSDHPIARGIEFEEGDVILIDHSLIYDGTFTSTVSNPSRFTHVGVVVFIQHKHDLVPAVLDIHPFGVRFVPLNTFVSSRFARYAEVYRRVDSDKLRGEQTEALRKLALQLVGETVGYDLNARPIPELGWEEMKRTGQASMVCSTLPITLFNSINLPLPCGVSELTPGAASNVARIGLSSLSERATALTPTDVAASRQLYRVGVIDNGFVPNIVRELLVGSPTAVGSFGHRMSTEVFEPFPSQMRWFPSLLFRLVKRLKDGLDKSGDHSFLRFALLHLTKSEPGHLPQAPGVALATIAALNATLKIAGDGILSGFPRNTWGVPAKTYSMFGNSSCAEAIGNVLFRLEPFDIREAVGNPQIRKHIAEALQSAGLDAFFNGAIPTH